MGRAFSRTVGVLAAGVVLTGAVAAAWAASEARVTVVTKASPPPLSGGSPRLRATPGFGLVSTSEKPPKFADYTILNLMRLATPWPIEGTAPQAEAPASVAPTPPFTKRKPRPKQVVQKPPEKPTWLEADWWRGLTWLRIR